MNFSVCLLGENSVRLKKYSAIVKDSGHQCQEVMLLSGAFQRTWLNIKPQVICFLSDEIGHGGLKRVALMQKKIFHPLIVLTRRTDQAFLCLADEARALACLVCPVDKNVLGLTIYQAINTAQRLQKLEKKIKGNYKSLEERKIISRAQGVLMDREKVDEKTALSILMHQVMLSGKALVMVARDFLAQTEQGRDLLAG